METIPKLYFGYDFLPILKQLSQNLREQFAGYQINHPAQMIPLHNTWDFKKFQFPDTPEEAVNDNNLVLLRHIIIVLLRIRIIQS